MRIAIIGAGSAGLTCAHLLHDERESSCSRPTVVPAERLLERLVLATQASEMSFSVSDGRGRFEYNGASGKSRIGNALAAGPAFVLDALSARGFERR